VCCSPARPRRSAPAAERSITQPIRCRASRNFTSLTDRTITNLPYDASGALVRPNGFGAINGVAPPRTLQLVTRVTF
jgi:hypothetical protein